MGGIGRKLRLRNACAWVAVATTAVAGVASAGGVVVKPIDQSIVDRGGDVVPLDASGSRIAFSATRSGSRDLGDAIYIADGDGSNMRQVGMLNGRSDAGSASRRHWPGPSPMSPFSRL
jgi:hypothetical protein